MAQQAIYRKGMPGTPDTGMHGANLVDWAGAVAQGKQIANADAQVNMQMAQVANKLNQDALLVPLAAKEAETQIAMTKAQTERTNALLPYEIQKAEAENELTHAQAETSKAQQIYYDSLNTAAMQKARETDAKLKLQANQITVAGNEFSVANQDDISRLYGLVEAKKMDQYTFYNDPQIARLKENLASVTDPLVRSSEQFINVSGLISQYEAQFESEETDQILGRVTQKADASIEHNEDGSITTNDGSVATTPIEKENATFEATIGAMRGLLASETMSDPQKAKLKAMIKDFESQHRTTTQWNEAVTFQKSVNEYMQNNATASYDDAVSNAFTERFTKSMDLASADKVRNATLSANHTVTQLLADIDSEIQSAFNGGSIRFGEGDNAKTYKLTGNPIQDADAIEAINTHYYQQFAQKLDALPAKQQEDFKLGIRIKLLSREQNIVRNAMANLQVEGMSISTRTLTDALSGESQYTLGGIPIKSLDQVRNGGSGSAMLYVEAINTPSPNAIGVPMYPQAKENNEYKAVDSHFGKRNTELYGQVKNELVARANVMRKLLKQNLDPTTRKKFEKKLYDVSEIIDEMENPFGTLDNDVTGKFKNLNNVMKGALHSGYGIFRNPKAYQAYMEQVVSYLDDYTYDPDMLQDLTTSANQRQLENLNTQIQNTISAMSSAIQSSQDGTSTVSDVKGTVDIGDAEIKADQ